VAKKKKKKTTKASGSSEQPRKEAPPAEPVERVPETTSLPPSAATTSLPPTKKSNLPPEQAHDDRDVDARTIVRTGLVVLGLTAIAMVGGLYLVRFFTLEEEREHPPAPPMATGLPSAPAGPRLQRLPAEGLDALRREEAQRLSSYAWVDKEKGIVQIPIERAIELVAERGLPVRPNPPEPRRASQPTDASLGAPPGGQP
jgi:hypothetical protein